MQNEKKFNVELERLKGEISILSSEQKQQIDNINSNINVIESNLETVTSKLENIEQNDGLTNEEMKSVNESLNNMQTEVNTISTQVANLERDIEETNLTFTTFENSVSQLNEGFEGIENSVSDLQVKVNTNTQDISFLGNLANSKVDKATTVNGKNLSSNIALTAQDVGALPTNSSISVLQQDSEYRTVSDSEKQTWNNKAEVKDIPTKTSQLENDSGYLSSVPSEYITEVDLQAKDYAKNSSLTELQEEIEENKQTINSVGNSLTQIEETIEGVGTSLADVQAEVATNIQDISYLNSAIQNKADKTEIPSVNNGILTIKKEGTQVATFSANQNANVTANIVETDPTVPSWAKASSKPSYSYSEITDKPTLATVATSGSYNDLTNKPTIPTDYATKQEGVYFVDGSANTTAGTWSGTNNRITSYYDGLVVNFKIGIAGISDGTTLNINGLGAKPCYLRGTTKVTTHYAVGTVVMFTYSASADAFYSSDYDANNYAYVRLYGNITTNGEYPILFSQNATLPSTYANRYVASRNDLRYNPYAKELSGVTIHATNNLKEKNLELKRKYSALIPEGTEIPASVNLNTTTYLEVGNYYCSKTADAKTLSNCPVEVAFMMQVLSPLSTTIDNETTSTWVYRLRKLITYTGEEYVQYISSGSTAGSFTYRSWERVAKSGDLASLETNLQDQISENEQTIQSIGNSLLQTNQTIEGIEGNIATLQADIATNVQDISYLSTTVGNKVDKTTTINGKALSSNITLTASDVGALSKDIVIPEGVKLYEGSGENTDGAVTQKYFSNTILGINLNVNDLYNTRAKSDLSNVSQPTITGNGTFTGNDRVVETKISSDGLTWYRIWASGWKECGGEAMGVTWDSTSLFTLPLPNGFSNTNYTVVGTVVRTEKLGHLYEGVYIKISSTQQIQLATCYNANTKYALPVRYYACGY